MNQYPHEGRVSAVAKVVGRRWLLIAIIGLTAMIVTFIINFYFIDRTYRASVKIIYPLKRSTGFIKSNLGALDLPMRGFNTILDVEPTTYNHVAIIASRSVREKIVDELDLVSHYGNRLKNKDPEIRRQGAVKMLRRNTFINDAVKGALVVSVIDRDPQMAATIANETIKATEAKLNELYNEANMNMVNFLSGRRDEVLEELIAAEDVIRQKKELTGILSLDSQAENLISTFAELEHARMQAEVEYRYTIESLRATQDFSDEVRDYLTAIENGDIDLSTPYSAYLIGGTENVPPQPQPVSDALEDQTIASLRINLTKLELELATKRLAFTDEHPEVIVLQEQVMDSRRALYEEMAKYYDASITTLEIESIGYRAQVDVIDGVMSEFEERMDTYPAEEKEMLELDRAKKIRESVLMVVEQELEEAEIRAKKIEMPFTLLDEALPPRKPIAPRLIVNTVVAGAISIWLTLYIVFWIETRARRKAAMEAVKETP